MAGKEVMTATSRLIDMLRKDYRKRGRKSLFYRYKENDLRVKFNAYKAGGSRGRVTDHIRLCELYDSTRTRDPDKAAEYMRYVISYLSSRDNFSSGKVYLEDFMAYNDFDVLKDFKDRWNRYLSEFGFGKVLTSAMSVRYRHDFNRSEFGKVKNDFKHVISISARCS